MDNAVEYVDETGLLFRSYRKGGGSDGTIHDLRVVFRSSRMHCYFLRHGLSKQVF